MNKLIIMPAFNNELARAQTKKKEFVIDGAHHTVGRIESTHSAVLFLRRAR